jgi:hypothetical protein
MVPLFADADVAAGASVVACLLAAITGLFGWLTARDKLKYDAMMIELRMRVGACEDDRAELRTRVESLEKTRVHNRTHPSNEKEE